MKKVENRVKGETPPPKPHPPNPLLVAFYFLLSLLVAAPLLLPGYILTLDMVFTPKIPAPTNWDNLYLVRQVMHLANYILPSQVIEKLLILIIMTAAGVGMHKLVERGIGYRVKGKNPNPHTPYPIPSFFAGVFYVINPFTYERWMAGHYLFLAGYAVLPWLVRALLDFAAAPSRRRGLRLTLWYTAMAWLSIHIFAMSLVAGAVVLGVGIGYRVKGKPHTPYPKPHTLIPMLFTFLILNSFWLAGVVSGSSPISHTINNVTNQDLAAFTTAGGQRGGVLLNVLGLHGFWAESLHRYYAPDQNLVLWLVGFAVLAALVAAGVRAAWLADRRTAAAFVALMVIAYVLATGVDAPLFGGFNRWVITHLPLARGFREPQKFGALLAFCYVYFAAFGVGWWAAKARTARAWAPAVLLLPFLYTPTMPFGFVGQLKPLNYPASWYAFNNRLKASPPSGKLLFLPWHEYMSYDFSRRIIASPAPDFFGPKIMAGTNAEFGGIDEPRPTAADLYIQNKVLADPNTPDMGARLAKLGVQYVMLSDGYGYQNYGWLNRQPQLLKISSAPGLTVYKNLEYSRG